VLNLSDALRGTRVIELDHPRRLAAAFCAKNLADLGADVVKLEDPAAPGATRTTSIGDGITPDPETAPSHLYLDAGKRSVAMASLETLLPDADLLIVGHQPAELAAIGLDIEQVREQHPQLSVISLTPFGRTGPDRDRPVTDLVLWAESGHMYMTGDPEREPLRHGWQFCDHLLGLTGALAAVTIVHGVADGRRSQIADVAAIEVLVKCLEDALVLPVGVATERGRCGNRYYSTGDFLDLFRCRDGFVMNTSFTERQWEALCHLVEHAEWLADPELAQWSGRIARQDELVGAIAAWMGAHGRDEVMARAQDMRIPLMKALRPDEVAQDPQVTFAGTFAGLHHPRAGHGRYVRFPAHGSAPRETPSAAPSPAGQPSDLWRTAPAQREPAINESSAAPLAGVRVLDLTQVYAGPMSTALLADLGADVIKVESAGHMDVLRYIASTGTDAESSWWFQWVNRGKRSVAIELATPEGRDLMLALAAHCDVVISNFGGRALPKLGLGPEVMREAAPQAVIITMPPFASAGPYRDYTSYGEALEFMTGVPWVTGYADDDRPMRAGAALCDSVASITAALSVVASLRARESARTGGHLDVSQHEAYLRLHGDLFVSDRDDYRHWGNRQPGYFFQGCARTADGWIIASAVDAADAARLRFVIGAHGPDEALTSRNADDQRWDELDAAFAAWAASVSTERASQILKDAGIPAAPVVRPGALLSSEQLRSREFFHTVGHPVLGDVPIDGRAFRLSDCELPELRRAPLFGEHTTEVLAEVLGMVPA
jgi:crotonobetainyl-CoA:carnitine CoA-transferase CaiB-like acyl-CoA transferase